MPHLYDPLTLRGVTFRNRIGVSPMCQYSSQDGFANDWHLVHLGSRAVGGAGLIFTEATAVEARGRISPQDLGIWKDDHIDGLCRVTEFVKAQGAVIGIQLAHAGRKGSTSRPWEGKRIIPHDEGGFDVVAPSAIPFAEDYPQPEALSLDEVKVVQDAFVDGAKRAVQAGFEVIELHAAHGYLMHTFHSPLSNHRTDAYGGSLENRTRFTVEIAQQVREVIPDAMPLITRISASDWVEGGWTLEDSVQLAKWLKDAGVDMIDCSSGGTSPEQKITVGAGYQVPFSEGVRHGADIPTAAVGMITEPMQADEIIRNGRADMVLMAREFLRNPYWALHAAPVVHKADRAPIPPQYERAF